MYKSMLRFVSTYLEETNKQKLSKPTKTYVPFAYNELQIPIIWKIKYIMEKLEQAICVFSSCVSCL